MITTQQVRLILDRNRNGLDGRPAVEPGQAMPPGLYWDDGARAVVAVESTRVADRRYVLLSNRLEITVDELVRSLAMGGGAGSGRAIPYHHDVGHASAHH